VIRTPNTLFTVIKRRKRGEKKKKGKHITLPVRKKKSKIQNMPLVLFPGKEPTCGFAEKKGERPKKEGRPKGACRGGGRGKRGEKRRGAGKLQSRGGEGGGGGQIVEEKEKKRKSGAKASPPWKKKGKKKGRRKKKRKTAGFSRLHAKEKEKEKKRDIVPGREKKKSQICLRGGERVGNLLHPAGKRSQKEKREGKTAILMSPKKKGPFVVKKGGS